MNEDLRRQLQQAQQDLDPQFKALRNATGALQAAIRLADQEKADALPMQKALVKLVALATQDIGYKGRSYSEDEALTLLRAART